MRGHLLARLFVYNHRRQTTTHKSSTALPDEPSMAADTTGSTYTGTMQSQESPRKHHSAVQTLYDMMSADETITGLPTRVPERRLRARKDRGILVTIENLQHADVGEEQPIRRRRKSDFEIYRDGRAERKAESSFETAIAAINASPASLKNMSPTSHSHRERRRREKEIEALEEEYVNDRRAKAASPITEEETEEITDNGKSSSNTVRPMLTPYQLRVTPTKTHA